MDDKINYDLPEAPAHHDCALIEEELAALKAGLQEVIDTEAHSADCAKVAVAANLGCDCWKREALKLLDDE